MSTNAPAETFERLKSFYNAGKTLGHASIEMSALKSFGFDTDMLDYRIGKYAIKFDFSRARVSFDAGRMIIRFSHMKETGSRETALLDVSDPHIMPELRQIAITASIEHNLNLRLANGNSIALFPPDYLVRVETKDAGIEVRDGESVATVSLDKVIIGLRNGIMEVLDVEGIEIRLKQFTAVITSAKAVFQNGDINCLGHPEIEWVAPICSIAGLETGRKRC